MDLQLKVLLLAEIVDKVVKRECPAHRPQVPQREAPADLLRLMERCWDDVIDARPTFDVILKTVKSLTQ